jgi:3,4-dihydroxy 2-butanone 4-phosphate synthase / GTP cyclohydrolase II
MVVRESTDRDLECDMSEERSFEYDTIERAVEALANGGTIIVVDASDRENEGDLITAAEGITPETVDFLLKHGRGVLCVPLVEEIADRLRLDPIVGNDLNSAPFRTHFLTPVDHRDAGTGVSNANRALTIRGLADGRSTPADFVRPGHVNPLLAKKGGVLRRAGHTEATIDLMQMAGLAPVGVLIEILGESGHGMADGPELHALARRFDLPIIAIEDLIRYRRVRERLVHREATVELPTRRFGTPTVLGYRVDYEDQTPIALVWGDLANPQRPPLVRMHSSCLTGDLLDSLRCDCGDQLHMAMDMIHREGCGVVVYLPQEGRGIGLINKLRAYELQDEGLDTVEANVRLGFKADHRDYMVGLQILNDLGLREIRLLTNNPKKTEASAYYGLDIHVVEQVQIVAPPEKQREAYMSTKRDKMGHQLPPNAASEVP